MAQQRRAARVILYLQTSDDAFTAANVYILDMQADAGLRPFRWKSRREPKGLSPSYNAVIPAILHLFE